MNVLGLQPGDPDRIGPYLLLGRLGHGGMGLVFLGQSADGRPVAVKVLRPDLAADSDFRARFRGEVIAAKKVSGPFTAEVVDADAAGPQPWLAMAYEAGPSLAEVVREGGPLPVHSLITLAAGLAAGLRAIRAAGLVHGDLKPANVLMAEDGPRMIDFGNSLTAEPSADVFGLGLVLAFAATGRQPFTTGESTARPAAWPMAHRISMGCLTRYGPSSSAAWLKIPDSGLPPPTSRRKSSPACPRRQPALTYQLFRRQPFRRQPGLKQPRTRWPRQGGPHDGSGSRRAR